MIGKAKVDQGLYLFHPAQPSNLHKTVLPLSSFTSCNNVFSPKVSSHVWHSRLGHLPHVSLNTLLNKRLIPCFDMCVGTCSICPLAK